MRILIRTSRLAIWSRRLGAFALPLVVIPVIMHRAEIIDSEMFLFLGTIGLVLGALAILTGLGALMRLWHTGDKGWGRAIAGLGLGILCLAPLAYALVQTERYPLADDFTTSPGQKLSLQWVKTASEKRIAADRAVLRKAFPNVIERTYQIGVNQAFGLVEKLVAERRWQVVARQQPELETPEGTLNVLEVTLLGWRDEAVIRVIGGPGRANVAMRSASEAGIPDLGRNGARIEEFLVALDDAVTEALREGVAAEAPPLPLTQETH